MLIVYNLKMCYKIKNFSLKQAISKKKNTLYICKTGIRVKTKNKKEPQSKDGKIKQKSKVKADKLKPL